MHRYEEYVECDGCGKVLGREDHASISIYRKRLFTFFGLSNDECMVREYDFCPDCAKKAKRALDDLCKKEK